MMIFSSLLLSYLCFYTPSIRSVYDVTPTKRSNAQHLVEYYKQFLQEANQKSGNVMQQTVKEGKDQESIQSRITPDPGYFMGK